MPYKGWCLKLGLLLCFGLTGCAATSHPLLPTSTNSLHRAMAATQPATATPSQPIPAFLDLNCASIQKAFPEDAHLTGKLVLEGEFNVDPPSLLEFQTNQTVALPDGWRNLSASADGKWLFYENRDAHSELTFVSSDGRSKKTYAKRDDWWLYLGTWISNTRFMFNILDEPSVVPAVHIIDLQTHRQQDLDSVYPGLKTSILGIAASQNFHFIYSSVVYDPAVELVVYPKTGEHGESIIALWDKNQNRLVGEIEDQGYFHHNPIWSLDGAQFYIAVGTKWDSQSRTYADDWFRMSRGGAAEQLTDLGTFFHRVDIGMASLSPSSRYLAFWLSMDRETEGRQQLLIMDVNTRQMTGLCLPEINLWEDRPVWSPDSRYLAVIYKPENYQPGRTLVVDPFEHWAVEVGEGVVPKGWLAE